MTTIHVRFKVRGRTAAAHTALNEVLLDRELGLETDTGKFKFGDGATAWNSLAYATADLPGDLDDIAALDTEPFGLGLLELADAGALRSAAGLGTAAVAAATDFQPADTDLTAIAAMTTATFGRNLLTTADAAALRTAAGLTANGSSLVTAANYAAMKVLLSLGNLALSSGTVAGAVADAWNTIITHASGDGQGVYLVHATAANQVMHGFAIVSVYGNNVALMAQWSAGTFGITFQTSSLNVQVKVNTGASTQNISWRAARI